MTCNTSFFESNTLTIGYREQQLTTWIQNTLLRAKKWYFVAKKKILHKKW